MALNSTSIARMKGVNVNLVAVIKRAAEITTMPFQVTEGLRTAERQKYLVATGKSRTMKSYHLRGAAVDLVAKPGGKVSWVLKDYAEINKAVQKAAKELGCTVTWGGTWKSIVDGPHWQIEK